MAISVGSVEVDVVPNTRGIYNRLRAGIVPAATRAGEDAGRAAGDAFGPAMQRQVGQIGLSIGEQIGRQIAARIQAAVRDGLRDGVTQGGAQARASATRQGEQTGGAFARSLRARLEQAFRSMPRLDVRLSDTGVDAQLARLRARMETLSNKRIGIDVDVAAADAELADIEESLRRLGAAHPNVTVRADTAAARASLKLIREEIARVTADPARVRVETDGAFGQRLRFAVERAEASLPHINIGADTEEARAQIASVRAQLTALKDKRVGIDIDAATAQQQLAGIQQQLLRLSGQRVRPDVDAGVSGAQAALRNFQLSLDRLRGRSASVDIRVDAAAAIAQLSAVRAMVDGLDRKRAEINISNRQALRAVLQLSVALAAIPAIPAIPVIAAGLGSLTAAAVAATVGVGALAAVAVPAFMDIAKVLEAQKAAQDAATTAAAKGGQTAAQAASRALQLEGAQQALAAAHRNSALSIRSAERAVADAVEQAAEAQAQAADGVRQARESLADAVQQAADRQLAAAERVEQAEESLADAQVSARQAQEDLTRARRDAALELEDLSNRLASAQLSERDATLDVQEARARLQKVQAQGSKASLLDQERAQLALDQAVQRLKEQQAATKRLADEKEAADKAGVEGSETVRQAQERLAQAQEGVRDQQEALARAQMEQQRTQVDNTRALAEAQQRLADAQAGVAKAQRDGAEAVARAQESLAEARISAAEQIASAERQVESAQLSQAGAADQAAVAQAKYQAALDKLSPSARGTFDAIERLREAFRGWSESLQPRVMPLFTRAIDGLRRSLPSLTPFVEEAADAVGELQDRASRGFKSPWWKSFKKDLAGSVRPAIVGLGTAFGNIFKGMAGVIQAFLPHMDEISGSMRRITARFAKWGTNLKGSPKFERFLSYSAEQAPILAEFLGDIADAVYQVSKSLAPLSGPFMAVLGAAARGLASIAETLPWLVQGLYLAFIATRMWTLGMLLFNAVVSANPITLIIIGIVALVAAVVYAYKRWGWFREAVQAAWRGIQAAAKFAWERILRPAFTAIWQAMQFVGRIAMWLWNNAIKPAFQFIVDAGKILAQILLVLVFGPVIIAFKLLAAIAMWLWKTILQRVFHGIASIVRWWWNAVLRRQFDAVKSGLRFLGDRFRWLKDKIVSPVFSGIRWIISDAWSKIRVIFDKLKGGVGKMADAFRIAKDGIKKAWDKIRDATKTPVKWVIEKVYNGGIVRLWNSAADVLPGVDRIEPMNLKGWASGGPVHGPGTATSDSILGRLSDGEHVWTAKEVQAAGGHGAVEAMRRAAVSNTPNVGPAGGIVGAHGGPTDWIGGAINDVKNKVKGWVLGGVHKAAKAAAAPIRALIKRIPGADRKFGSLVRAVPTGMLDRMLSAIKGGEDRAVAKGNGQWVKPVDASYGTRFGVGGSMWASGRHTGLDFPAPVGAIVRAVADGQIAYAKSGGSYGKHILINHGGGLQSLYAHLSAFLKRAGSVVAGEPIGKVGATGNVTGPHLHLEARINGTPVDPMAYLEGGAGGFGAKASGAAQRAAKDMLSKYGWGPDQFGPLRELWERESNWRWNARNPSSGAYGIPQALPANKMASAGSDWRTNPITQIRWGLGYIRDRYGSPARAWSFWNRQNPHWYDNGGYLPEGLSLVYNGTGRPEAVITPAQERALLSMAADRGAAGSGGGEFTGTLTLDNGAFVGQVRGVLHQEMQPVVTRLRTR